MNDNLSDHDLLIRLDAKMDNFITGQSDQEVRIRSLEAGDEQRKGAIVTLRIFGGISVFVVGAVEPIILHYLSKM